MGQKKLKTGSGFETLLQTRDLANNGSKRRGPTMGLYELGPLNICFKLYIGPKKKEPTNGLNGLGPLNICLKLEIGPTMGQREIFLHFFFFGNIFFIVQQKKNRQTKKKKKKKKKRETATCGQP